MSQNVATVTHWLLKMLIDIAYKCFFAPQSRCTCTTLDFLANSLNISSLASLALTQLLASSRKGNHVELPAAHVEAYCSFS